MFSNNSRKNLISYQQQQQHHKIRKTFLFNWDKPSCSCDYGSRYVVLQLQSKLTNLKRNWESISL